MGEGVGLRSLSSGKQRRFLGGAHAAELVFVVGAFVYCVGVSMRVYERCWCLGVCTGCCGFLLKKLHLHF
jgi:hypothetical protein